MDLDPQSWTKVLGTGAIILKEPFGLPLATFSEIPTSIFLLCSALLNSMFVEMYHTIAINTLRMTFGGLLLPFYCCVMDVSFCHHLHFLY